MPKSTSHKKTKKAVRRHDPLEKQILTSMETGTFKAAKPVKVDAAPREEKDDEQGGFMSDKMSRKIMEVACLLVAVCVCVYVLRVVSRRKRRFQYPARMNCMIIGSTGAADGHGE